jgi:isopentenyl-diphosphate delta-isomerase
MSNQEILDLVSNEDLVVGTIDRQLIYQKDICNFRVINAFIINSAGKLWIPTRHPSKELFPLCLDCSVGGHVKSQESYFDAFIRESLEETRLDPRKVPCQELRKLSPYEHGTSAFMTVYALHFDGPIQYNVNDFVDFQWLLPVELLSLLQDGSSPSKGDLKTIVTQTF